MAEVEIVSVSKAFGKTQAVSGLSLTVGDGEFVALLGPTGAGKTTALRLIAGLEQLDSGSIRIDGRDMTAAAPADRDVAFVFQQYSLYPHLTVFENMAFALRAPTRRVAEADIRTKVQEVARLLHIETKLDNKATQLSGGQMQRVAIGRALVRSPSIYLMDEPLSSLDAKLRGELRLELKRIQVELGATILYVTHDQTEAMTMASRIGVIEGGRLMQIGTPREIYENPINAHVAARLGQPVINLLPAALFGSAPVGAATVGARTEHLTIARGSGDVSATVKRVEHLGDQSHLHLDLAGRPVVTLADPEAGFGAGDVVSLRLNKPLFFDANGWRVAA
ncbi:ABC transporter ATP-binding protein [uncultured Bradyrhizobium sp.]|jgi:multiple sugar transport system ATP-binding protein|uniref:ABC transporter ATP-binding protein n=1 Tax=uncultured Bradyrhizobium sp. TaxID=199684 RepID=UPI0026275628|nr:ABC transporter ATP-binding protein [uncultured Bradyrhizobium sp.]